MSSVEQSLEDIFAFEHILHIHLETMDNTNIESFFMC